MFAASASAYRHEAERNTGERKGDGMRKRWLTFAGILIGMSISGLMQTFLATALPTIAKELGGMELYSWVFGGYMLASTVTLPLFGKIADIFGRRQLYLFGMALFVLGTLGAGMANKMSLLVAFRVMMGLGAGAIVPAALASIGDLFDERESPRLFGYIGLNQVMANLVGPVAGGVITDVLSWRWGFYLLIPLGILSAILVGVGLQEQDEARQGARASRSSLLRQLDWLGAGIVSAGLCLLIFGVQFVGEAHFIRGAALLITGGAALYVLVRMEKNHRDPIIPMNFLSNRRLSLTLFSTFLLGMISNCAISYVPLFIQDAQGVNASEGGLLLLPMMAVTGIASAVSGRIAGQRLAMIITWLLMLLSFAGLASFGYLGSKYLVVTATLPLGIGMGLLLPMYMSIARNLSDYSNRATIASMVQLSRNLGGAAGVPVLGIWLAQSAGLQAGLQGIFICLGVVAFIGWSAALYPAMHTGTPMVKRELD
ncbi:MFS transporter [Paenibacillus dendritiformis]|uniref:MFS transporter n=1 Tax=Paenibacillus dendritiformis TaxID=130049 RepID=UPI00365B13CA